MFEVFDANLKKQAVLHLAYNRKEDLKLNGVSSLSFTLPADDPKNAFCVPFAFVHDGKGQYYRILTDGVRVSDVGERTYTAEHGIATLVDNVMFGAVVVGGTWYYTSQVINFILAKQAVKRWVLWQCEIEKQFEYGFEHENLFNALMSVPNLFTEKYKWTYDMSVYPWRLSLRMLNEKANPSFYIRAGKNLLSENADTSFGSLCTRLYLLGKGEGDNQTTITDVNGGIPYLQAPANVMAKYGLIEKIYVDRTIETEETLLERGRVIFPSYWEPHYKRKFGVADLRELTKDNLDTAEPGDLALLAEDKYRAWVTGVRRNLDIAGDMTVEMSSTTADLASDLADLADRQRINEVYSQGVTQVYQCGIQQNADTKNPCVLNFYIPKQMIIVNRVLAKISLDKWRTYSRVTGGGGAAAITSTADGAASITSSSGGGTRETTNGSQNNTTLPYPEQQTAGASNDRTGMSVVTMANAGNHFHQVMNHRHGSEYAVSIMPWSVIINSAGGHYHNAPNHRHSYALNATWTGYAAGTTTTDGVHAHGTVAHTHTATVQGYSGYALGQTDTSGVHSHTANNHDHYMGHYHRFEHFHVMWHTHEVTVPSHTHKIDVANHTHKYNIPNHEHELIHGVYRSGNPSSAVLLVNGVEVGSMNGEKELDVTSMLYHPTSKKIPRESWIRFGVRPDDIAYISITIFIQGFIQSRGGGKH